MLDTAKGPKHELNAVVLIKRWKVKGTIVARSFSPLRYDIQCRKRLHRGVPEDWLVAWTEDMQSESVGELPAEVSGALHSAAA